MASSYSEPVTAVIALSIKERYLVSIIFLLRPLFCELPGTVSVIVVLDIAAGEMGFIHVSKATLDISSLR